MVIDRFYNPFPDLRLNDNLVNHAAKKQRRFGGSIELAEISGTHASRGCGRRWQTTDGLVQHFPDRLRDLSRIRKQTRADRALQ